MLEDEGYTIEDIDFTELLLADVALTEGSVDVNVDQHTAYMENYNEEKGANLTKITPVPTVPAGIFPGRKDSLDDIEAGDRSEEHTSELQSRGHLVCRLLL